MLNQSESSNITFFLPGCCYVFGALGTEPVLSCSILDSLSGSAPAGWFDNSLSDLSGKATKLFLRISFKISPLPFFDISSSVKTTFGCSYDGRVLCVRIFYLLLVVPAKLSSFRSSAFCNSAIFNRSIFSLSPVYVLACPAFSDSYSLVV